MQAGSDPSSSGGDQIELKTIIIVNWLVTALPVPVPRCAVGCTVGVESRDRQKRLRIMYYFIIDQRALKWLFDYTDRLCYQLQ